MDRQRARTFGAVDLSVAVALPRDRHGAFGTRQRISEHRSSAGHDLSHSRRYLLQAARRRLYRAPAPAPASPLAYFAVDHGTDRSDLGHAAHQHLHGRHQNAGRGLYALRHLCRGRRHRFFGGFVSDLSLRRSACHLRGVRLPRHSVRDAGGARTAPCHRLQCRCVWHAPFRAVAPARLYFRGTFTLRRHVRDALADCHCPDPFCLQYFRTVRSAYEEYRELEADYLKQRDLYEKKKTVEAKKKMILLRKQCEEKKAQCVKIHRNAVHQSNMYLINKILWLDDNARGLRRLPSDEDGRYDMSIETLRKNYIVENYTPFDGAIEFATGEEEYLNKSYYLKMIGILPESFDELGKNAKEKVNKTWATLTDADIKTFDRITSTAIKYQDVIRGIQKRRHIMDDNAILNAMAEFTRS